MTSSTLTKRSRSYLPAGQMGRRLSEAQSLQLEIQRLSKKLEAHRSVILEHMINQRLDKIEFGDLVITKKIRHNWQYSPATLNEMQKLRIDQRFEQTTGVAIDQPTIYVAFATTPGGAK